MTNGHQRRHPRISTDIQADAKPARRTMFEGRILNLSVGGAFVETREIPLVGTEIILTMTLDLGGKRKSCMLPGKVVWIKRPSGPSASGFGVQFVTPSASMLKNIEGYLKHITGKTASKDAESSPKGTINILSRGQLRGG